MNVKLYAKMQTVETYTSTTRMLDTIASQSRTEHPLENEPREGLFKNTILWRHESIQEFADYIFWVEGVSRTELQQHARHRMQSLNVKSGRHCHPNKVTIPEGVEAGYATITLADGSYLEWSFGPDGDFTSNHKDLEENCKVPLENLRMTYPDSVQVNFFMKMNGRSLRNFMKLRMDKHAQWEIRELANKIHDIIQKDCPPMIWRLDPYKELLVDFESIIKKSETNNKFNLSKFANEYQQGEASGSFYVIEEIKKIINKFKKGE